MPKRPNPFLDYGPMQLKTHVGMKQMASGTMGEKVMKEVYERTQEKLFSAMQHWRDSDLNANHAQSRMDPISSVAALAQWNCDPRQMVLDKAGHLTYPSTTGWYEKPVVEQETLHPGQNNGMSKQAESHSQCGQINDCGQFSNWINSDNSAIWHHSPVTFLPASGGQLCLDSKGYLTVPRQFSAMECGAELPQPVLPSEKRDSEVKQCLSASEGNVKGCRGFPHMSAAKHQYPQAGRQPATVKCQTCQQMAGSMLCQFCERRMCRGCGRQCHECGYHFCSLCSTLDYNTSVERPFCLSCVG